MTVSRGVEGQLISEARICIYSDIKALKNTFQSSEKVFPPIISNVYRFFAVLPKTKRMSVDTMVWQSLDS